MHKHLYVVYEDTTTDSINQNDLTHMNLIDQGYQVIHKDVGYSTTRYEYMKQLSYQQK